MILSSQCEENKATITFFVVAKYLDRANLVSRMANAIACFVDLIPLISEKTAFPESKGNSIPEKTCRASSLPGLP